MVSILTIRPPEDLKKELKNRAKKLGLTVNGLIIQILWDYVNNN